MPLQDHFRPPLSIRRHWHAFHNAWATYLAADLNRQLPEGYFAEPNVQFGIQVDVAAFEEDVRAHGTNGWSPPAPTATIPVSVATDVVEVVVYAQEGGPTLAGAIELVSPANKDRAAHRDAFVFKCAAYLQQGVGLVVVDVVTDRHANLHAELSGKLQPAFTSLLESDLYAVAYRPVEREGESLLDLWEAPLAVGQPLPELPLYLRGGPIIPVELERTYARTCEEHRVLLGRS